MLPVAQSARTNRKGRQCAPLTYRRVTRFLLMQSQKISKKLTARRYTPCLFENDFRFTLKTAKTLWRFCAAPFSRLNDEAGRRPWRRVVRSGRLDEVVWHGSDRRQQLVVSVDRRASVMGFLFECGVVYADLVANDALPFDLMLSLVLVHLVLMTRDDHLLGRAQWQVGVLGFANRVGDIGQIGGVKGLFVAHGRTRESSSIGLM